MEKELIQSDPAVMMGKPTITGTRITVELVLEKLAAGESLEQILQAHPRLTPEGVRAARTNKKSGRRRYNYFASSASLPGS
jgi:uncharacterized protein (DUF433 family)